MALAAYWVCPPSPMVSEVPIECEEPTLGRLFSVTNEPHALSAGH